MKNHHLLSLPAVCLALAAIPCKAGGEIPEMKLPEATSNNAAAMLSVDGETRLYSFSGLGAGKTHGDIHSQAWEIDPETGAVRRLPDVPGGKHRLASVAIGLHDRVFLFGGYTVDADGNEVSTPEVYEFNPVTRSYKARASMPVPVDDTVAGIHENRYIYLVSGWHDTANVDNVQVFDTWEDRWFQATPYPGTPVFGHAGGIVDGRIVVTDGVGVLGIGEDGKRRFGMVAEAWLGTIKPGQAAEIHWQALPTHPGDPFYRMAALGDEEMGAIVFAGGSDNPYNYDGIGYNGIPAEPSPAVFAWHLSSASWQKYEARTATMDHRSLLKWEHYYLTIGGMKARQGVSDEIKLFELKKPDMPVDPLPGQHQ